MFEIVNRQTKDKQLSDFLLSLKSGIYTTKELFEQIRLKYPFFNSVWDVGLSLKNLGLKSSVVRKQTKNVRIYYINSINK